jgi:hypothetical protein
MCYADLDFFDPFNSTVEFNRIVELNPIVLLNSTVELNAPTEFINTQGPLNAGLIDNTFNIDAYNPFNPSVEFNDPNNTPQVIRREMIYELFDMRQIMLIVGQGRTLVLEQVLHINAFFADLRPMIEAYLPLQLQSFDAIIANIDRIGHIMDNFSDYTRFSPESNASDTNADINDADNNADVNADDTTFDFAAFEDEATSFLETYGDSYDPMSFLESHGIVNEASDTLDSNLEVGGFDIPNADVPSNNTHDPFVVNLEEGHRPTSRRYATLCTQNQESVDL